MLRFPVSSLNSASTWFGQSPAFMKYLNPTVNRFPCRSNMLLAELQCTALYKTNRGYACMYSYVLVCRGQRSLRVFLLLSAFLSERRSFTEFEAVSLSRLPGILLCQRSPHTQGMPPDFFKTGAGDRTPSSRACSEGVDQTSHLPSPNRDS